MSSFLQSRGSQNLGYKFKSLGEFKRPSCSGYTPCQFVVRPQTLKPLPVWTKKMVPLRRRFPFCQTHRPLLCSPVFLMPWTPAHTRPRERHSHFSLPGTEMLTVLLHCKVCAHFSQPNFQASPVAITLKLGTLQAVLCTPLMCHPLCGFNDIWYWLPTLCAQPGFLWILIQLLDDLLWHLLYTIQLITPLFPHSNKW